MTSSVPAAPVRYQASFEQPEEDEADTIHELLETMQKINRKTYQDDAHGLRSVHAKSHGLLTGNLQVLDNLPPVLVQGLFAHPGSYPLVMRLSTVPGDLLDDKVSTPRGMAIKLIGVPGERLSGDEGETTQDFLMVNGPAFGASTAKKFLGTLKLVAATTDKGESLKKVFSAVARGTEKAVEALGGKSGTLIALGGHPQTNILGETFYSQAPQLYGPYMAKFSIAPVSAELTALKDAPVDLDDNPDGLRAAVCEYFDRSAGEWELRVQLCTDLGRMPVEDASVPWPEDVSPYIPVARIHVPAQTAWSEDRSQAIDDGMAFDAWHTLAAHRPIGSIMRARKAVYSVMAAVRARQNKTSINEPTALPQL